MVSGILIHIMNEHVEIFCIDEEGILLRAFAQQETYYYIGDPEDDDSPLHAALRHFYSEEAPSTLLVRGYETPRGQLFWESEWATPFDDEGVVEIGERLYLVDDTGERFADDYIYELLSRGDVPEDWYEIESD